ncbi:MBL fold metallo-hydrolase [Sorangium cellulosum]|uniref:MBL fold metallo-hydrolase n=1 Tax=Sorangium cellulosum TaxID=56 RepID=UPI0013317CAE|nr:MBL fold metallo-hydrolase [Sorangium cellulosum]
MASHSLFGSRALRAVAIAASAALAGCAEDPDIPAAPDESPLEKAFAAIGGRDAVTALSTFRIESSGSRWLRGEAYSPDQPASYVGDFTLDLDVDATGDRFRLHYARDIHFLGMIYKTDYDLILNGEKGHVEGTDGIFGPTGEVPSDRWASTRKQQRLLNPHFVLRDIAADPALVLDDKGESVVYGKRYQLVVVHDAVSPLTLYVDAATGTIDRVTITENDPVVRDTTLEIAYAGWAQAQGGSLSFPSEVSILKNGELVHHETRSSVEVGGSLAAETFALPDGMIPEFSPDQATRGEIEHEYHEDVESVGVPFDAYARSDISAAEIAPGIHHLTGGSHHSLLVEQANGLILVEAPLGEVRSQAILDWVGSTFNSKPITHVVATHFHSDHSAGVRTIAAAGAEVVVGEPSVRFYQDVFARESTILPDALAKRSITPKIRAVARDGQLVLEDERRPVVIYPVQNSHAVDMVFAYVPQEKLVFVSDLLIAATPLVITPPFTNFGRELNDAIEALGIEVSTFAAAHGAGTNTYTEFVAALGL